MYAARSLKMAGSSTTTRDASLIRIICVYGNACPPPAPAVHAKPIVPPPIQADMILESRRPQTLRWSGLRHVAPRAETVGVCSIVRVDTLPDSGHVNRLSALVEKFCAKYIVPAARCTGPIEL